MPGMSNPPSAPSRATSRRPRYEDENDGARDSILEVALRLLEEQGYAGLTTDAIAAEASISKATLYRHWRSKQQIVIEAVRLRFKPLTVPDLGSFKGEVAWVLSQRIDDYRQPGILRLVAGLVGAATTDAELAVVFDDWVEQLSRALRTVIQRGIVRGDVRPDVDSLALETLVSGVIARSVIAQRSFSEETVLHIADLIDHAASPSR